VGEGATRATNAEGGLVRAGWCVPVLTTPRLPIRIRAGAFGRAVPSHDLFLSPDHAVFADGVLIPVRCLMNGTTVAQMPVDQIRYYHVELPAHDVLFAEALPVESFLDTGSRGNFANGGGAIRLHSDYASIAWDASSCFPLMVTGPEVAAMRARLSGRAGAVNQRRRVAA
jgi:collagen type I alpha